MPASFPRGVDGVRSSVARSNTTGSQQNHDIIRCKKSVKFGTLENEKSPETSPVRFERKQAPKSDDPKTSEYAFFKKLKANAGKRIRSDLVRQDKIQSNKAEFIGWPYERKNIVGNMHQVFRASPSAGSVAPYTFASFESSVGAESKKADIDTEITRETLDGEHSLRRNLDENDGALNCGGAQHWNGKIFCRRRQKLHQWVADTSFPEVEDFCFKGYDIVNFLLGKLFPHSNEEKCFTAFKAGQVETGAGAKPPTSSESDRDFSKFHWDNDKKWFKTLKTGQVEADDRFDLPSPKSDFYSKKIHWRKEDNDLTAVHAVARPRLLASPESDIRSKKLLQMPVGNLVELEGWPCCDIGFPSCWMEIHRERELPNSNSRVCRSPKTCFENRIGDPNYRLGGRTISILCTEGDPSLVFGEEKYLSHALGHIKERHELDCPRGLFSEREIQPLVLDWDWGNRNKEKNLSITCQNTELSLCPIASSSQDCDQRQNLDNRISASGSCMPAFLSNHLPCLSSLWCSSPASFTGHKSAQYSLGARDDILAVLNDLPLSVPLLADYSNFVEFSNMETSSKVSSIFLSPRNHIWFMSKFLDEGLNHPCANSDFYLGQKSLSTNCSLSAYHALEFPRSNVTTSNFLTTGSKYENCLDGFSPGGISNSFHKDMVSINDWSSIFLQMSIDNEKPCPSLPDQSHWNKSERETYSDDREERCY